MSSYIGLSQPLDVRMMGGMRALAMQLPIATAPIERYHVERTRARERDDFGEEGRMLLRRIYKYMKALPNYRLGTPGLYHYTSVT